MESNYVEIYQANGLLEAETIRIFLESNGIKVFVSQESAGITLGLTVGPLGIARIYVPEENLEQAKRLISAMERGDLSDLEYGDMDDQNPNDDLSE